MNTRELVRQIAEDPKALRMLAAALHRETAKSFQPEPDEDDTWVLSADAWKILGLNGYSDLLQCISRGLLRIGHEVRDIRKPGASKPRYQINLSKAKRRLEKPPEKRA